MLVETEIVQQHLTWRDDFGGGTAAPLAPHASDLEQIGEVARKRQSEHAVHRAVAVVLDPQPLIGGVVPQKDRADDMKRVLRQHELLLEIDVGIGQIDGQQCIVVAHIGAQQQKLSAVELQFEQPEETRVAAIQPVRAAGRGADVAMAVENREAVVVFEIPAWTRRGAGRRNIERHLRNLLDQRLASSSCCFRTVQGQRL